MACAPHKRQNAADAPSLLRLLQIDREALATYQAAAKRLEGAEVRRGLEGFVADCRRHLDELERCAHAGAPPDEQATQERQLLRAGRMMLAQVLGDRAVLRTLRDVVRIGTAAYAEALADGSLGPSARAVVARAARDERRHRRWLRHALHPSLAPAPLTRRSSQ